MQIEFIYSFDKGQKTITYPFHPCLLKDKETFFEFSTSLMTGEEKETLVKISCCIYYAFGLVLPENHWYEECNGKFWQSEINELMIKIWAIRSIATIIQ